MSNSAGKPLDAGNDAIDQAKKAKKAFHAEVLSNGDTLKQLLARSRYVLYRRPDAGSPSQKERADLFFEKYPKLKQAYNLSLNLSSIFEKTTDKFMVWPDLPNGTRQ